METTSFGLTLANLLVGLCKGARQLRPYSLEFGRDLAYALFGLELSLKTQQGTAVPDAVATSVGRCNTLLFEWTATPVPDARKRTQLARYAKVVTADLVDVLGVEPAACGQHDIVVIVLPDGVTGFTEYLESKGFRFPLLSFGREADGFVLRSEGCRLRDPGTATFFDRPLVFSSIPLGYVPFPLDSVLPSAIARPAVQHLVSMLVKQIDVFAVADLCERFTPLWRYIDVKKQHEICGATQGLLKELERRRIAGGLIERADTGGPVKWRFRDAVNLRRGIRAIRTALDAFIAEKEGISYQLSFDDM